MNFKTKRQHRTLDINLTPLVDVVLLLVLFFMVTAQFSTMPGLQLILPDIDAESQVRVQASERLEIGLTADGDLYFEDQPTSLKNLSYHLRRTGATGDEVVIVVLADQTVAYGQVIKIMDILRNEGFNRVVFAARPETGGQADE